MAGYRIPTSIVLAVLVAVAVAFGGLQARPERPVSKQDQVQALLKRVERLEAQVAELKRQREAEVTDRKRELEAQMAEENRERAELERYYAHARAESPFTEEDVRNMVRIIESPYTDEGVRNKLRGLLTDLYIAPEATLDGQRVPKNWIPREFNGMRYYDIPINSASPGRWLLRSNKLPSSATCSGTERLRHVVMLAACRRDLSVSFRQVFKK